MGAGPLDDEAPVTKGAGVLAGMPDVEKEDPAVRLHHAGDLLDGPATVGSRMDVVEGEAGNDDVEGSVRERKGARVTGRDLDPFRHPFGGRVGACRPGSVPGQVARPPDVDPDRQAGRETSRGSDQEKATPAAHIEHGLVASPGEPPQEPSGLDPLALTAAPEHEDGLGDEEAARPDEP